MQGNVQRMKVYCETSFWSWLVSRPSANPDNAVKQAWTRKWWQESASSCDVFVSDHVLAESSRGDLEQSRARLAAFDGIQILDGSTPEIDALAQLCLRPTLFPKTK